MRNCGKCIAVRGGNMENNQNGLADMGSIEITSWKEIAGYKDGKELLMKK